MEIALPHNFTPRVYQVPLFRAVDNGFKRAVFIWHRRAGKDKSLTNLVAKKMMERVGAYYYFFPTYNQGRKILWDGMDRDGFRFIHHFPKELISSINNQEMKLTYKNGSLFQVVGTDNINSIVGTNPVGCVFSEYSLQDPKAWDFIRPILAENDGWAVFNYTPRGHNHGKQLYDMASASDKWFVQLLTVDDTKVLSQETLDQEKAEMLSRTGNDGLYMQEYYCSFDVPIEGAYYGKQMMQAELEGRIGNVPYEPQLGVETYWDLGMDDSMTIWFVQRLGREVRLIDYYENSGEGIAHYAEILQDKHYVYTEHYAPHDIAVRELGTGKSRSETAKSLGIDFEVIPKLSVEEGIEAARNLLSRCWFDKTKCQLGLNALNSYHKEWDEKNETWKSHPQHDWSSHGADSFRYLAVGLEEPRNITKPNFKRHKSPTGY
jgi:hypothetical protein